MERSRSINIYPLRLQLLAAIFRPISPKAPKNNLRRSKNFSSRMLSPAMITGNAAAIRG
jgi:hypothetical protein